MKLSSTAALRAAILCTAAIALSACAYDGRHHNMGYDRHSDDPCDNDSAYCGYPVYEGGVYYEGNWYDGRYRYRDQAGKREYWVHGGWHSADQVRGHDHDADHDAKSDQHDHDRDQKAMEHAHERDKQMKEHEHDSDQQSGGDHHDTDHDANSDQHDKDHDAAKAEHDKEHAEDKAAHDKAHDDAKDDSGH